MNDSGRAHVAVGRADRTALTSAQLAEIADQAHHPCPGGTKDFAHLEEDPFTASRAYVYATSGSQKGLLENTNQAIKISSTYAEAMDSPQHEEWKGACGKEMDSLRKHNVYNRVPLRSVSKGEKMDGRFKARLVVGGHLQEAGHDYGRSYAPVCRLGSIPTVLAIAFEKGWPVYQMEVVVAFLNAHCDRDVYVKPAPRDNAKDPATGEIMDYNLERSLYGLSQSPSLWNDTLDAALVVFDWRRTQSDPCVYVYGSSDTLVILTIYVDDILLTGKDQNSVNKKKKELTDRFEMTDMGEVRCILGIEVHRDYKQ